MVDVALVAQRALRRSVRSAWLVERMPIGYDPFLAGRGVDRVAGQAEVTEAAGISGHTTWRAVVKRSEGAGLRGARRERAAYELGIAAGGSDRTLCAPTLLSVDEAPGHVEVWLEELLDEHAGQWPLERFGLAAEHIARWVVEVGSTGPQDGFDSEDAWAERHGQPERVVEAVAELDIMRRAPAAGEVMAELGDEGFARTQKMIVTTQARIDALARLPQTLLHHDLVRSNLFALPGLRTAAIDWENVGRGPFGVDLAPLVSGSVRRGEASGDDLPGLERVVLDGYARALGEDGGRPVDVLDAYHLALGLRWHIVLGCIRVWLDPTMTRIRGSRPEESRQESLHHLVVLAQHLLAAADSHPG